MRNVIFQKAVVEDAALLAQTRKKVWNATYRGIYPDEMIDGYDFAVRTERDRKRIEDPNQAVYLAMDGAECVGYLCFGPYFHGDYKDFKFCLYALYFLPPYQGCGLGRKAFEITKAECLRRGYDKFFCCCHARNFKARGFYGHMGGHLGSARLVHKNPEEDQVFFEFYLERLNEGETL